MSTMTSHAELAALRDTARSAEFELALAYEEIAQKVAAGDRFTTAQQNAAAQLLEISAAVRELAAEATDARATGPMRAALPARAQQLAARTAELRAAFGSQPVSRADLVDRPGVVRGS